MGRPIGPAVREVVAVAAIEEGGTMGACGGPIRCCLSSWYLGSY